MLSWVTMAQVEVSMDLGYGNKGYSYMERGVLAFDGELPKGQEGYFAPKVGFIVSDGVSAGVRLEARYGEYDFAEGYFNPELQGWQQSALTTETMLAVVAGVYLRIRCADRGRLSLHVELMGSYGLGWGQDERTEFKASDSWEVNMTRKTAQRCVNVRVVPVATYALGEHVGVDLYLNLAAISFCTTTLSRWPYRMKDGTTDNDPLSKTVTKVFDIGLNALNTSFLSMGFRYVF